MKSILKSLLVLTALMGGRVSQSQFFEPSEPPPPSPGNEIAYDRNISLQVIAGGLTNGQRISGTNVNCSFGAYSGMREQPHESYPEPWMQVRVLSIEAQIGGESVEPPTAPGNVDEFGFQVRFHSNHFDHLQYIDLTVTAQFKLTANSGATKTVTLSTTIPVTVEVYNKGYCFGTSEFEESNNPEFHGVAVVAGHLRSMNHDVIEVAGNFSDFALESGVKNCTAFYFNGHGAPYPSFDSDEGLSVGWREIADWLSEVASDHAPINLAYISACNTARYSTSNPPGFTDTIGGVNLQDPDDPTLNHGFSTFSFLYESAGGSCIDRAQVGWRVYKWSDWTKTVDGAYFGELANGRTAHEARDTAIAALQATEYWEAHKDDADYQGLTLPRHFMAVFGDWYTRLWKVYSGSDSQVGSSWYWAHH